MAAQVTMLKYIRHHDGRKNTEHFVDDIRHY